MPFEARELPEVIFLGDEAVPGPFCVHCGYPWLLHKGAEALCPAIPNVVLRPSCECHEVKLVRVKRGRQMKEEPRIVRRRP